MSEYAKKVGSVSDRFRQMGMTAEETVWLLDFMAGFDPDGLSRGLDYVDKIRIARSAEARAAAEVGEAGVDA